MEKVIYPGTFDPFSLGHLDLTRRALLITRKVVIAVSESPQKSPMFSFEDRLKMARLAAEELENVEVVGFTGLLVDAMRLYDTNFVLRGIRGVGDFEFEFQMAQANRSMLAGFEPIFLMPSEKYMVLSSTIIRDVARHGGNITPFLPQKVDEYIKSSRAKSEFGAG